ncbi:MAG: Na/Pi cotransporter family protein [Planctomycetota bacterium]|jgi:phosphate:Na+ symporter
MEQFPLLTIFGGVALLVFGVRYLRKGLDRLFGKRLGPWMQQLGAQRGLSFLSGIAMSVVAASSTTMSLLAVQMVQAGHMTARQMLTIVLGANIGLTIKVLLISVNLEQYAPIVILAGVALYQFTPGTRSRGIGQLLLAIGFIFLGIDLMKEVAQASVAAPEATTGLWAIINFDVLQQHPLLLAVFAVMMAMALQSSTATIGLAIGLSAAEAMSFRAAVPVVLGANVGLAVTTLIVGWRAVEPRRLALANLLLKVVVAAVGLAVLVLIGDHLPEPSRPVAFGLVIAAVHTGYNVVVAAVGLPLVGPVTKLMARLVPTPPPVPGKTFGPRYISSGPVGGVALALGQSLREVTHVSEIIRGMLHDMWAAMKTSNDRLAREVGVRDDKVDLLDTEIKRFLTTLAREEAGDYDADEQMRQLRYLAELETIGDIIDKNLCDLAEKKIRLRAEFSPEGAEELDGFFQKVAENAMIAETAFTTRDKTLAQQLLRHKERIDQHERDLRDRHFTRLNEGLAQSHETSAIHLDLLTHLKRINSHVSHVAYAILQDTQPTTSTSPSGAGE